MTAEAPLHSLRLLPPPPPPPQVSYIHRGTDLWLLWGAGIAQWLERRTRDWKVAGSNPCWNGGRIFFSRVDFLCWLLFRYPFHPRVTTVARKKSRSFCQKCRWQVTAKHACTLRIEPCFGIGHNLSLICQMTSEDIKHQLNNNFDCFLAQGWWLDCTPTTGFLQRCLAHTCRCLPGPAANSKRHRFTTSFLSPKRTVPESDAGSVYRQQTPSIDLRHPFSKEDGAGKRCWECGPAANSKHRFTTSFLQRGRCRKAMLGVWTGSKLQASIYDILSPKRTVPESDAGSVDRQQTPSIDLRHPFSKEDGAGKRCWECGPAANSKHRFTTSFLQRGRCRKAMLGVWTGSIVSEFLNWSTSFHPCGVCRCDRTRVVLRCVSVNRYHTMQCVHTLQDSFIPPVFVFCHRPDITGPKTPTYWLT